MENVPSPINNNFPEKEILSKNNIENKKVIFDSSFSNISNNIKNNNTQSSNDLIKKQQNILNNNDINFDDLSSQENNDENENDILIKIKKRFNDNIFFTNINNKLIYLNSFCNEEDIFGKEATILFKSIFDNDTDIENGITIDTHIFKTINKAILELKKNFFIKYSFLLQGDSYSGKTKIINEALKYIISNLKTYNGCFTEMPNINNLNNDNNFNSNYTNKNYGTINLEEKYYSIDNNKYNVLNIPKKILASFNILEAFGNAKTKENDNSTRIINYIKLRLNKNCNKIIGFEIFPFLFDKNRVSNLEEHTRNNFNIFYYLANCEDNDLLNKLFLSSDNITNYNYLKIKNKFIDKDEISYNENKFIELKEALITLGFSNDEILTIFKILSAIILLGNVELNQDNNYNSSLNQNEILLNVCQLLNIDINEFVSALVNQETFNINICNEIEEIEQTKNNFVNELYYQLFLWIINKINNNINNNTISESDKDKSIMFLDFPGFENNSINNTNLNFIEQLFINYINELVYYFYIKDLQEEEIEKEIIKRKDLINSMNYLLGEIKNMQNDKQMKIFISNFIKDIKLGVNTKRKYTKIKNSNSLIINSSDSKCFLIKHSIGDISYNINNILIKNVKNFIPWNLLDCLLKSNDPKIRNIYKNNRKNILSNNATNNENKSSFNYYSYNYENIFNNSFITFSEEYMNYIKEIKKEIKQSKKNYIICIKSNPNDDPLEFDSDYISQKLNFYKLSTNEKKIIQNNDDIRMAKDEFINNYEKILKKYTNNKDTLKNIDYNQKELFEIIENFIKEYNNKSEEQLILKDDFQFIENDNILINKKFINILEEEKKKIIFEEKEKSTIMIQSGIKSYIGKNKINNLNSMYSFIQNSLRILFAKKKLNDIQTKKQFLLIQLELYINKLKNKTKIQNIDNNNSLQEEEKDNDNEINNEQNEEIEQNEENEDNEENINEEIKDDNINKLNQSENIKINNEENNSFDNNDNNNINDINFNNQNISNQYLIKNNNPEEEKNQEEELINNNINNEDKLKQKPKNKEKRLTVITSKQSNNYIDQKDDNLNSNKLKQNNNNININSVAEITNSINILQEKLLFDKIETKKICTKKIFNTAYTLLASRYYIIMRKKVKIIQKYFKEYLLSQKMLENAIGNYIKNKNDKLKNDLNKKIDDLLFPYKNENINEIENMKSISKENNYNNIDNNTQIRKTKNKNNMTTSERYREYKKMNPFFNIKKNNLNNKIKAENDLNQQNQSSKVLKKEEVYERNKINKNQLIKNIPNLSNIDNNQNQERLYKWTERKYDYNHYNENKIYLLSKVIDIDIFSDIPNEDQNNELLWAEEYKKIYEYNLKNKTPIQQIYLSDTHTLLINNMGNIFLFGKNDKGQCGLKNKKDNSNNYISANEFLENYNNVYGNVKEAVLKDGYTLILNKQGKTFSFNENESDYCELNTSTYNNENSLINNTTIQPNIKNVQGGGNINLYLSKSKEVYLDLSNKSNNLINNLNPNPVNNQSNIVKLFLPNKVKIKSISCGYNFYILLSSMGKVYSGGSNLYNELCSKINIKQRMSPEEIYDVSNLNENIIQVSCGFKHVAILSEKNNVYGWGNNSFCQLLSPKKKKTDLIKLNCDKKILQISCGFRSTFFLDEKNEIYFCGILNKNRKNNGDNLERIYIEEKNNELGNKNEFIPVKINAKWNKLFSLLYINFADIRNITVKIEDQNNKYKIEKIKYIMKTISSKWLINSIKIPYIKEIHQYFNENYMEKPEKIKKEIYY